MSRAAAASVLLATLLGCGHNGNGLPEAPSCPNPQRASVSRVNDWPGLDPVEYAAQLAKECRTLVEIEGIPWYPPGGPFCDEKHNQACNEVYRAERQALLRAMSAHKITVLINSHNSNAYAPKTWTNDMWRSYIIGIREDMITSGADVWLGAPSEPWAWRGERVAERTRIARAEWPGVFVQPDLGANRVTGRPYFEGVPYDFLEVHPCSFDDALESLRIPNKTILVVTDCTPVIAKNLGAGNIQTLFNEAQAQDKPLIIYDWGA